MPVPINDATIKLVWENNPDTSITSTNLSKGTDYVASYFNYSDVSYHKEGTILNIDTESNGMRLILKRGTVIGLVNTIEKNGNKILSENDHYRMFDVGLEDIWLTVNDMDDSPSNPSGNWGQNLQWSVYMCDKMDDSLIKDSEDKYGGGGQILISQSSNYPIGEVPGQSGVMYNEKAVRKIGGFKSDSVGKIITESIWDISQRHSIVRASDYYIFGEYDYNADDYNRFTNRKLRLSDLDSSSVALDIKNSLRVYKVGSLTDALTVNVDTNTVTIPTLNASMISPTTLNATNGNITNEVSTNLSVGTVISDLQVAKETAWASVKSTGSTAATKTSGVSIGYGGAKSNNALHVTYADDDYAYVGFGAVTGARLGYEAIRLDNTSKNVVLKNTVSIGSSGTLSYYGSTPSLSGTSILGYNGHFYATRVYNAVWNDLAEYFLSADSLVDFGRVYIINSDGLVKTATKRAQKSAIGVASDTPGFILKSEYEKKGAPIALAGSVRVWVRKEVKSGVELVSDKNGYATPANWFERIFKRSAIIGKSIEPNLLAEPNRILMLVK